jgi:hypothetical protein
MRNVKDDIKPFRHTIFKEDNDNHNESKFDNIDKKVAINDANDIKLDTDKSFQNINKLKYNNNSNKENQFKPILALDDKQNNTNVIVQSQNSN